MQELRMKVYKEDKKFFFKIKNMFLNGMASRNDEINSFKIKIRRKQMEKMYSVYIKEQKDKSLEGFEYEYLLYVDSLDKHIINKIYKRAQNREANEYEKKLLENYYIILTIKEKCYDEYKNKKEIYLLDEDYKGLKNNNKLNAVYEKIYFSKIIELYNKLFNFYVDKINSENNKEDSLEKLKVYLCEFEQKTLNCTYEEIQKNINEIIEQIRCEIISKDNTSNEKEPDKKIQIKKYATKDICYKVNKTEVQKIIRSKKINNDYTKSEESSELKIVENKERGEVKNEEKDKENDKKNNSN